MKRFIVIVALLLFAAPLSAQTIPPNFRAWFDQQVAGKPFGQQTLLEIAPLLPCVGSHITPPNAKGERTKLWDPNQRLWIRVGFGDVNDDGTPKGWVYVVTDQGPAPQITEEELRNCGQPAPTPREPIPALDLSGVYARLTALTTKVDAIAERQIEDSRADLTDHHDLVVKLIALADQLKAHDEKPSELTQIFGNRYVQMILAGLGTYLTTHQVMK